MEVCEEVSGSIVWDEKSEGKSHFSNAFFVWVLFFDWEREDSVYVL